MAATENGKKLDTVSRTSTEAIPAKVKWDSPIEFILACLGYAVGLGNVWRFPYLCYRNGGGAFLIPFFLMLVFIGLPLFYLELYIGQYTGLGPLQAFAAIAPAFSGLGYCTVVIICYVCIYFMVIVAWNLFYTIVSLTGNLGWGSCDNSFNSAFCYSGSYDKDCRVNNTGSSSDLTFYLKTCMSVGDICVMSGREPLNGTHCDLDGEPVNWYSNITRVLASEEYYNERVLGRGDATWEQWGELQWHLVGCLFASWLITFFVVIKGVQSAGKVVYFTALFPYVMLTALLIRGVTLEGAGTGISFYLTPDWGTLLEARVWGDAASQIFYSFGVACGSLVTLASYNNYTNNSHFDAIFVSFANFATSVYAGFAIFSVLGFQALQMGVSVDDVTASGPGLAFVVYPEALLQMPVPTLWSILFFFMLFILGLGSQFAGVECVNTAIADRWPVFRKRYWMATAITCTAGFVLGLPMCFSGGVYLFTLFDWNTASWAILIVGAAEAIAVSWAYGVDRALEDLASMGMAHGRLVRWYWKSVWTVFMPIGGLGVLVFVLIEWTPPAYEDYIFPAFADAIGWIIGGSTIILLPVGLAWAWYHGYRGKSLFTPTPAWKSAQKLLSAERSGSVITMDAPAQPGEYDNMGYIM
ncbi:hypothetical protein JYU34_006958 [Plutella xylostella]|uniref:Transporter n=1 Tax=Plutella xylostella TaxID=51655 RepID=A0ABQ7QT96_PLUXY|nr:hypothetical protein JYU34_006958 [Plutella xylostella]